MKKFGRLDPGDDFQRTALGSGKLGLRQANGQRARPKLIGVRESRKRYRGALKPLSLSNRMKDVWCDGIGKAVDAGGAPS